MSRRSSRRLPDLQFGILPVSVINKTIGTDFVSGEVIMSGASQRHAASRHPNDYPICLPHVAQILQNPLYVGDDLKNRGIEIIGKANTATGFILIALNTCIDERGRYNVSSFYIVSQGKINGRRDKGFLLVAKHK